MAEIIHKASVAVFSTTEGQIDALQTQWKAAVSFPKTYRTNLRILLSSIFVQCFLRVKMYISAVFATFADEYKKSLYTTLRADICKLYSKVFPRAGKPNSRKQPQTNVNLSCSLVHHQRVSQLLNCTAGSDCLCLTTETNLSA